MNVAQSVIHDLDRLRDACPAFDQALKDYDRVAQSGDTAATAKQWELVTSVAAAFRQGAAYEKGRRG